MFLLSALRRTPPKTPRNVYFPWHTVSIHKSGTFLEQNRLALRVPIHLTKFEIREYLRKIYDAKIVKVNTYVKVPPIRRDIQHAKLPYYRNGPMYKKAIVTLEHAVPDAVKMIQSCRQTFRNPDLTKKNIFYGVRSDTKGRRTRAQQYEMGESNHAWRLPIPNLLNDDRWNLNPELHINEDYTQMRPDTSKPFIHSGAHHLNFKPKEVPQQTYQHLDLTPWRRRLERSLQEGAIAMPGSQKGSSDDGVVANPAQKTLIKSYLSKRVTPGLRPRRTPSPSSWTPPT